MTDIARRGVLEPLHLFADPRGVGLLVAPLHVRNDAFEGLLGLVSAKPIVIDEFDLVLAGAMQDDLTRLLRQVFPRIVEREFVVPRQRFQRLQIIRRRGFGPWRNRAFAQGHGIIRHDQCRIEIKLCAEAVAGRASAMRIVERKQPGLDLRNGEAGNRAGEFRRHDQLLRRSVFLLLVREFRDHQPVGKVQCRLDGVGQAVADVLLHRDAVHHHFDVVLQFLVERGDIRNLVVFSIHFDALEALLQKLRELLAVFALAAAHDGRKQIKPRAFLQREDAVRHLADGLAFDGKSGCGRIGHAHAREEQAQIIVDLGDGAHGRTRVFARRLLLYGDSRREALDMIHIRLLHQFQELACIGRQRLDITALAFGVDRVESEGGFAGAR